MATQLSPELMARLSASPYYAGFGGQQVLFDPALGMNVMARYAEPTYQGEGAIMQPLQQTGYSVGNYNPQTGSTMNVYDLSGNDTGQTYFENADRGNFDTLAMLAAAGLVGGTILGAGAAGGGGVSGLPSGAEADLFYGGGLDGGATLGGGASVNGGAALGAGGFLGDATAAGYGGLNAASTSTMGGGASVAGGAPVAAGAASGLKGLLGPAAALLGAAAGSQPQERSQTLQQQLPDYLKGPVTGQGGLLDQANTIMRNQMQYVPLQGQQIANQGLGLLTQPIAGNGVGLFNQKFHFGG